MKKIIVALLISVILMTLNACRKVIGHGPVVNENRTVSGFTAINMRVPGDLYFVQDSIYKIEIEAQENIIREIETSTNGTELKIRVRDHVRLRAREDIRITVSAPSVTQLTVSGSGTIKVLQPYKPASAKLSVSGSGTITINQMETNNIDASVSGSGELFVMTGTASHEDVDISGSGRIDLLGVIVNTADTRISGSGSIKLYVNQQLTSKISGSGRVYYKGNPVIHTTITGSGKVTPL